MYTIKEVAKLMDISEHTLRFWAKSGFFPSITRDSNNVRLFSEHDLGWVKIVKCLRTVGTENKAIKPYIDLYMVGDSTIPERFGIIKATKIKALQQMEDLKNSWNCLIIKKIIMKILLKIMKKISIILLMIYKQLLAKKRPALQVFYAFNPIL